MSRTSRSIMGIRYYLVADARDELQRAEARHGPDHPAVRAVLGALWFHLGRVPQRGSSTPEAVAWHRESGAAPGYMNRAHRRHLAAQTQAAA